ncbi:coiled-coil domain-containing protein 102B-like isoform X3 [Ciona intestinalis]
MSGYPTGFENTTRFPNRHSDGYGRKLQRVSAPTRNEQYFQSASNRRSINISSVDSDSEAHVPPVPKLDKRGRTKNKQKTRSRGRSLDNALTQAEVVKPKPLARTKINKYDGYNNYRDDHSYQGDVSQFGDVRNEQWDSTIDSRTSYHQRSATTPREKVHLNENEYSELQELRMRTAQMEKTLRWWSECTSNWREKWTKVRAERNRAREEFKRLKEDYDNAEKELTVLRQQKVLLINENTSLKHDASDRSSQSPSDGSSTKSITPRDSGRKSFSSTLSKKSGQSNTKLDEEQINQKAVALQLRVEESVKTVQAERDTNLSLNKRIETLEQELSTLQHKYDELKSSKQDLLKQLSRKQESHRLEVVRINTSLDEELENRNRMEKKIHDLREEIEKLQEENTAEWGKRERLETEKLQLERENKRLKSNREEIKAELDRKFKATAEDRDNELRHAQAELHESREELNDLRRHAVRDEKLLNDRLEELEHSRRRAEQHEVEVRALRSRVEDMKKQQTSLEDELDLSQNQYRRMVRVVEERDEEVEKLNFQMEQVQSRARRNTSPWPKNSFAKNRETEGVPSSSESSCEV